MSSRPAIDNRTTEFPANTSITTTISSIITTTIAMDENSLQPEEFPEDDSLNYVFVPLAVFLVVIILSALVYLMARTKRTTIIGDLYKRVKRSSEYTALEATDDEQGDNDDAPNECLLAGKLQIENRYDSYPIYSYNNTSQRELFA